MATKKAEKEKPMVKFICEGCGRESFDLNHYFYDKPSTKCIWCSKYPVKTKKDVKSANTKSVEC